LLNSILNSRYAEETKLRGELFLQRALSQFSVQSYNITGVKFNSAARFVTRLSLSCECSRLCIQEFDCSLKPHVVDVDSARCHVFPGISKKYRSNAIIVNHVWIPWIINTCYCDIACALALRFGTKCSVFVNMHVPFQGHSTHTIDECVGCITAMLEQFKLVLRKKHRYHLSQLVFVWAGDFNSDFRCPTDRN
jgi:hypothetical protein